ncbi:MAG: hypothetical protein NVS2B2_24690 [Ktedonobacteraceae bacterium]
MNTESTSTTEMLTNATKAAHEGLLTFEALLRSLSDAHLHLANTEGGWTVAQVVSHIHICGLLWIADLERMRHDPSLFIYREELGHDVLGAPPHSAKEAANRIASLRHALDVCLPAADPSIADKQLEVPTLGKMTISQWMMPIIDHLLGHAKQAREILVQRGVLTAENETAQHP